MRRVAKIYVNSHAVLTTGVRALFEGNDIECVEIDITNNASMLDRAREQARSLELPVVELDGMFVAVRSILELSRTLGLTLPRRIPAPCGTCC